MSCFGKYYIKTSLQKTQYSFGLFLYVNWKPHEKQLKGLSLIIEMNLKIV